MPLAAGDPSSTDVVIAIFGASAGLGGLVLVFLALVIAAYQGLRGDVPGTVKARARAAGPYVLVVFALCLASVGMSLAWLALPGGDCLYHSIIGVFVAQLSAIFLLAVGMTIKLLK